MENNELRIGNFVRYRNEKYVKVSSIGSNGFETKYIKKDQAVGSDDLREYNPIPLTDELLSKFGFDIYDNGEIQFIRSPDLRLNGFELFFRQIPILQVEYVHQLQNIYFYLTGQELEII